MVAPIKRFELAARGQQPVAQQLEENDGETADEQQPPAEGEVVTRRVREGGRISLEGSDYYVGAYLEGETVEVVTRSNGLVDIQHRGVFLACHARRRPQHKRLQRSSGQVSRSGGRFVLRSVDPKGAISFAGGTYTVAKRLSGQQVEVRIARGKVRISRDDELLCTHAIRYERAKELGAFAIPKGRPRQHQKTENSDTTSVAQELEPIRSAGTETWQRVVELDRCGETWQRTPRLSRHPRATTRSTRTAWSNASMSRSNTSTLASVRSTMRRSLPRRSGASSSPSTRSSRTRRLGSDHRSLCTSLSHTYFGASSPGFLTRDLPMVGLEGACRH